MKSPFVLFFILILLMLLVPAALILWPWRRQSKTKLDWLLRFSVVGAYVLVVVLGGFWSYLGLHLRWILLAAFFAAAIISFWRALKAPFYMHGGIGWWLSLVGSPTQRAWHPGIEGKVIPERLNDMGKPVPLLIEGRFLTRNSTF